jgi:hypothetical protein
VTFLHAAFLFGLASLAIPPVVHLLNRRRYETVPWAAVMFLPESTTPRQRLRFQHFPLMLLRMGLLALLAFAFAAPQFPGCQSKPSTSTPRDILILIDGSASMARGVPGQTPAERAKEYVRKLFDSLEPNQRVSFWVAKHRTISLLDDFTSNRELLRNSLDLIPQPSGTVEWPAALQHANTILDHRNGECEIVVLTDGQKFGWTDAATLPKWGLLAQSTAKRFPIQVVTFAENAPSETSNARLEPLRTDRATAVADREIRFSTSVRFSGIPFATTVRISVDGSPVNTLNVAPLEGELNVPVEFAHRFPAGSHLVSFELSDDAFACDNRQDFAIEVLPVIPVLIIDGNSPGARRGSDFLRDALAPQKDTAPAFSVRTIAASDWQAGLLQRKLLGSNVPPRVVALMNLDKPTSDQCRQIERFLREGGSVFVALGESGDAPVWNRLAYRGGEGFLPARVINTVGELSFESLAGVPRPFPSGFSHPSLEIFKEPLPGGLGTAVFPMYWKLDPNAGAKGSTGTAIAQLTNGDPWLVESTFGAGRVILSAHPFDDTWKTNLHRLPDFVRLSHELFYFLSGTQASHRNLQPGQPLLFRPPGDEPPGEVRIRFPDGRIRHSTATSWPLAIELEGEPGAYQLTTSLGKQSWYAVGYDARESDFTPNGQKDRERVAETLGQLRYVLESDPLRFESSGNPQPRNFWWLLLGIVFAMLLAEVFVTRKLVRSGDHVMPEVPGR